MKKASDPRHQRRRKTVKELFAQEFVKQKLSQRSKRIFSARKRIDTLIMENAPAWPIEKLNRVDLAILRLAVFELLEKKEPLKVVIDEAVELAKEFGSEGSPAFVNGVLGSIVKKGDYAGD